MTAAVRFGACVLALVAGLCQPGCSSPDDARVLQVLNQRGFGRPTQDANRRYYIGIGDGIVVQSEFYPEINGVSETVRMDGTITLPDVGEVFINGLTPDEATEVVRQRYDHVLTDTSNIVIRVSAIASKRYYVTGAPPLPARSVNFNGDTTLMDVVVGANIEDVIIDTDNILVIRGDPENPLRISCDYDDIVQGYTRDNILIRENDIIYLTPNLLGYLKWGVAAILSPLEPIQKLFFGVNNVVSISSSFGEPLGNKNYGSSNNNFNSYN
jgi:protein involved in polysaccharide export with SLBB domain